MSAYFAQWYCSVHSPLKNAQRGEFLDIGSVFGTDQQAFLSHFNTQLSKMLNAVTERLWSQKHKKSVRMGAFAGNALLKVQYVWSSQDDAGDADTLVYSVF